MINKIECLELLPEDFDPLTYIGMNPDLEKATEKMSSGEKVAFAKSHYLNHGKMEGRKYVEALPKNFDPLVYINLNPDLEKATEKMSSNGEKIIFAKRHYLKYGKKEKRRYLDLPKDFDPIVYLCDYLNKQKKKQQYLEIGNIKKAYIHIGYGKTGTTSIQDFFYDNYEVLKNNKILYSLKSHLNYDIVDIWRESEDFYKQNVFFVYKEIIDDMLKIEHDIFLLSSERFVATSNSLLLFLKNLFSNYEINIIFYVRKQVDLIPSIFLEDNKYDLPHLGKDAWEMHITQNDYAYNFNKIIEPWEKVFGKSAIKASLYHPEIIGKDIRPYFLNKIGINNFDLISKLNFQLEQSNTSISPLLSNLIIEINKNGKTFNRNSIIKELLNISKHLKGIKHSVFTPEQEAEIKKYYAKSNAVFADKYLTAREKELLLS